MVRPEFLTAVLLLPAGSMPDGPAVDAMEQTHFLFRSHAMTVLLGWSVLNLVAGSLGAALFRLRSRKVFWGANAAWNLVNLAIATAGLLSARAHPLGSLAGIALAREIVVFQGILLVNVGLDVGYVATGVVTYFWGRERSEPWRRGVGSALILQGGFLFVFDVILTFMVYGQLLELWAQLGA